MSKIESGKLELAPSPVNLRQLLNSMKDIFVFRVEEKKIELTLNVADDVPENLYMDGQRFSQVVSNLVSNAVKFTPEHGSIDIEARMVVAESRDKPVMEVSVKDTGIGISAEQQAKLFTAFTQAENTISKRFGGTGLGLAICKNIVHMMGGEISVVSEPGEGSEFFFTIPITEASEAPIDDSHDDKTSDYSGAFAAKRILLAEDMEINREVISALLEDTGIEIDEAENGKIAVDMFVKSPGRYDLVLMDVQMPEMDGLSATRAIRSLGTRSAVNTPIIAMTANVFKEDVDRCLQAGMNAHVGKPVEYAPLCAALKRYL
jgi:CheY-like chemotaxis protein